MALDKKLFKPVEAAAPSGGDTGNQEEGLILYLDANDVDSFDGQGDATVWYDITNHEYKPATNPSEHFNTVLYTGSGNTNAITGVGFQPDLVWIKNRDDNTSSHALVDSVRGLSASGTPFLQTNDTDAEAVSTNMPSSIDSDGFTLEGNQRFTNESGDNYVAWCFRAGGAPTATNTATSGAMTANSVSIDGTLESAYTPTDATIYPKKISANTKLGFSTVLFEGTGNSNNKVPHGLGVPPELIIYKNIDEARSWVVGTDAIGWTNTMKLEANEAAADRAYFDDIKPTGNVFEIYNGQANTANDDGSDFIAYCFASKRGVSKVGSYAGTGSSGNKVYTGFEPAWILVKKTNGTGSWEIIDNKRGGNKKLYPDLNNAEFSSSQTIEFNRDGFTLDGTGANASSSNYIYLAFAKDTSETDLTPIKEDFTEGTVTSNFDLELDANDYSGSGNWLDSTSNNNDGIISGATYVNDGSADYFSFDGNDKVTITAESPAALEMWVYANSTSGVDALVGHNSITSNYVYWNSGDLTVNGIVLTNLDKVANKWTHIVVVESGSNIICYKDGEAIQTISGSLGTYTEIGGRTAGTAQYLTGRIGQVRMYSSALTPEQVKTNYDATKIYPLANLELHLDPTSYSGSGTTWTADTGSNATVVASRYDQELGDSFDISTDGESTIQIASGHGLNGTNFTLEFWYKWQSTPSAANRFIYDAGTGWNFFYYSGYGWRINNDDCATGYFSSSEGVTVGKWYHFVITQNSSQNKVYIDGELLKTTSVTSGTRSLAAFDFGSTDITADKPKCDIGQIRTYSSALSQDQIRQNFNFTKNDYPNGYNGTISGATWNSSGYFNFDGSNDYVDTNLLYKENNTISMWVNFTSNSSIQLWGVGESSYKWIYCAIKDDQDSAHNDYTVNLWIRQGSSQYNYQNFNNVTLNSYGNWNFLTFRMEELTGANFYMSVNGGAEQQSVSYLTSGTVTATPNDGINIGRGYTNGTWSYGNSKISKFKVHDKPLTQAEITALNNEGE